MAGDRASLVDCYEAYQQAAAFAHLRTPGIHFVPGRGDPAPTYLVVGEAPGASENAQRRPFVGASGAVINALMENIGMNEDNSFITNVVKYRPPGNRTPNQAEVTASIPYLRWEWKALGRPRYVIAAGSVAKAAFGLSGPLMELIRTPIPMPQENPQMYLFCQYHPAFGLRRKSMRGEIESQWATMREQIRELELEHSRDK